jgi:hypothetical protein
MQPTGVGNPPWGNAAVVFGWNTRRWPQRLEPAVLSSVAGSAQETALLGVTKLVGATGFEPATFRPQPSGFRCLCVSERPSCPMCPGPWTIWPDRTVHRVPKRYHGSGVTVGHTGQGSPPRPKAASTREGASAQPGRSLLFLAVASASESSKEPASP